jgi:hypothetical protein
MFTPRELAVGDHVKITVDLQNHEDVVRDDDEP